MYDKWVTETLVKLEMECLGKASWGHDQQDLAVVVVAAETEPAPSLVALTLDFGEGARGDS
jgi:hypothetical protein